MGQFGQDNVGRVLTSLHEDVEDLKNGYYEALGMGTLGRRNLKTKSVTAKYISTSTLAAVSANTGSLTVTGALTVGTGGSIGSGQTAYNTGSGFWLEYNGGTPRFSIGNGGTNALTWNGTTLAVTGSITATSLMSGKTAYGDNTNAGYFLGLDSGTPKVDFGTAATIASGGSRLQWDGSTLTIGGTFKFGSTGQHTLDNSGLTFTGTGSTVAYVTFSAGVTPVGSIRSRIDSSNGDIELFSQFSSTKKADVQLTNTTTDQAVNLTATGGAGSNTSQLKLLVSSGVSDATVYIDGLANITWTAGNRATSLYGRFYPGSGSATQASRYIEDDGTRINSQGPFRVVGDLWTTVNGTTGTGALPNPTKWLRFSDGTSTWYVPAFANFNPWSA